MASLFPSSATHADLLVFIEATDGAGVLRAPVRTFALALGAAIEAHSPGLARVESYFSLQDEGLPPAALAPFVSPGNASTFVSIDIDADLTSFTARDLADYVREQMAGPLAPGVGWQATEVGVPAFLRASAASVERDMGITDAVVLPIALAMLGYMLRAPRLLLLPITSVAACTAASFGVMYFVARATNVFITVPSLMMTLTLALSLDYNLFLLMRYREELLGGADSATAVTDMLRTAGHTVFVSGVTLCVCFAGLGLFPLDMMRTIGYGCCISVLITLSENLILTPALILEFAGFFERGVHASGCGCATGAGAGATLERRPLISRAAGPAGSAPPPPAMLSSMWFRFGTTTTRWPCNAIIIIAVVAATVPFALQVRARSGTNVGLRTILTMSEHTIAKSCEP